MTTIQQKKPRLLNSWIMLLLGVLIGVIGGYGALIFRSLISLFHNLLFQGHLSTTYDASYHAVASIWGIGVILVPLIGSFGVTWIVKTFAPEAKGHGVPEVIDAIYYKKGKIRPRVAICKAIASALSIGSGGSVGREGPIIQIGAAFGSALGQFLPMPTRQCITLIAAGAGAGIAATFNAPIGGVAFAIELLLLSVNAVNLAVVSIATVTAAYISRSYLGIAPAFNIPGLPLVQTHIPSYIELIAYVVFGSVMGLLACLFNYMIYWLEDIFDQIPRNVYIKNAFGMLLLGIIMYVFMYYTGHYYIQGVGYATITDILANVLSNPVFLLFLCFMKIAATSLTLGAGGSGGIFSPSLFIGATFGAAWGNILCWIFPAIKFNPIIFALAGMSGMISGATGAVLTAITMLFEMTRDYNAILPIFLAAALAYMTRKMLSPESIYTLKLQRRGHNVHQGLQAAIGAAQKAQDIMNPHFLTIPLEQLATLQNDMATSSRHAIIVTQNDTILGVITAGYTTLPALTSIQDNYFFTSRNTNLLDLLRDIKAYQWKIALVTEKNAVQLTNICGIITAHEIAVFTSNMAELMQE